MSKSDKKDRTNTTRKARNREQLREDGGKTITVELPSNVVDALEGLIKQKYAIDISSTVRQAILDAHGQKSKPICETSKPKSKSPGMGF